MRDPVADWGTRRRKKEHKECLKAATDLQSLAMTATLLCLNHLSDVRMSCMSEQRAICMPAY